ncbi:MAG TPA: universal stress protein [Dehalococcoidales bacterium]|nr:universal stress protein [Dehalococcoidales bacterium]
MYKKIVVPLDGSKLAEVVLPHLEKLAGESQAPEILLVSVTEKIQGRVDEKGIFERSPGQDYSPGVVNVSGSQSGPLVATPRYDVKAVPLSMGKMTRSAYEYLEKTAAELDKKGFKVSITVLAGNPADEIIHFAEEQKAEAIMIGSRGKSGFSRWDLGNIAEKIIRASQAVVILVKPEPGFKETKAKRKGVAL